MTKRLFSFLTFVVLFATAVHAQNNGTAKGKIISSKDGSPVDFASVVVKKATDSSTVAGNTTTSDGSFNIPNLSPGKYILYVGFVGMKTINQNFELTADKPSIDFGALKMGDDGVQLSGVEVKSQIPPVVVKKDTIEINAATLKVKENSVVEDLLKKVPGVDVAKDGTVTTQGETIKRVRVDGKDFMGSDPLLATKNLPADMVDKIQIIDDMSEQSKFSGVDDGNREKIINIVTKNGIKNKGYIGNNSVGYGSDDRYDVNLNVNRFDENQQISLIGQFNNVNKQNFGRNRSFSGGRVSFGGGGAQQQGITTTNAAGINFGDTYEDGTKFNGSYFFNKTSLFNTNTTRSQTFLGDNVNTNNSDLNSNTDQLNHRLSFMVDTKLDSTTSIRIEPNISYSDNSGNSVTNYVRNSLIGNATGSQTYLTHATAPQVSNNLLLRKKFARRGRTISLNLNTSLNDSKANNFNINPETVVDENNNVTFDDLNQLNNNKTNSFNNTARLVYTEPLSKTTFLELNYQNGYAHDNSQRFVYNYNTATNSYDIVDAKYTNEFENTTITNALGLSFSQNEKKYNWNVGLALQQTHRENDNLTTGNLFKQNFTNLTPSAEFRYNFSNSKRLRIRYDGRTNQPSISQIQPIPDNTNTQTILVGNPNLKPSFSNSLRIFYNNFDFASYRTLFLGAFVTQTFNGFGNSQRLIDDPNDDNYGKIANSYTNVDGNISANAFGSLSLPLIKGTNKLNFQINAGASYGHSTNFTTNLENVTNDYSINNGYKLVSNLDKLDMVAGISGSWSHSTYTVGNNTKYYTLAPNIDISYLFPGNIRLQTDVTYNKLTGRGAGFDTDYTLMNAYISRQFFNNKGTFKLSVNDLLNQNTGVLRTSTNNSIIDQNFNVLKRYYMLTFTYSLSNIAGLKGREGMGERGDRPRGGFPGGPSPRM